MTLFRAVYKYPLVKYCVDSIYVTSTFQESVHGKNRGQL